MVGNIALSSAITTPKDCPAPALGLIIGYGNPLRCDDGFGWVAAQRMANDLDGSHVQVVACQQLTPELAEPVSRATRVVFVDARVEGVPGQIVCQQLSRDSTPVPASAHHLTPAALLAWADTLYGANPDAAWIVSVTGACFDHGEGLSPALTTALPATLDLLTQLVVKT